jgi:uncharacterized protein (DUF2147 family)
MKRLGYLAVLLLLLGSSAHAGSYSFTVHGHRVRVERPRHCFSRSCLSVTMPGLHGTHPDDRGDDIATASDAAPAKPASTLPPATSASSSSAAPAPAPVQAKPVPVQPVAVAPAVTTSIPPPPARPSTLPVEKPPVTAQVAPPPAKDSEQATSEPAETPLGDWQTEGNKGLVRIEACGNALCGYVVDAATNAKGETILINMKPKMKSEGATDWTGTIVSRASGSTYYAKMALKQSNTLRVEACTVGRFFCSGNDWSRIVTKPQALINERQAAAQPPS